MASQPDEPEDDVFDQALKGVLHSMVRPSYLFLGITLFIDISRPL
jgi:hypothetical protein